MINTLMARLRRRYDPSNRDIKFRMLKFADSYHHADGLTKALSRVKTRFCLILDPDFFIVEPEWASKVIKHMRRNEIAVFGAPWNPRWFQKYRYFPAVHCMVLGMWRLGPTGLDFMPDLISRDIPFISLIWEEFARRYEHKKFKALRRLTKRLPTAVSEDLRQRGTIARSRNRGYWFQAKCALQPGLGWECVQPVFNPRHESYRPQSVSWLQTNPLAQFLLPDKYCYLPKRPEYYSRKGFFELGFPHTRSLDWEEYLWQGRPFAFHVRGEHYRKLGRHFDLERIEQVLNLFRSRLDPPALRTDEPAAPVHSRAR